MRKPELLAPAGDLEKLKFAFAYGADAVYAGGTLFGLRAYAGNLDEEDLRKGISFAHERNRKLYVTVNIFAHEHDFEMLPEYLRGLRNIGADGIIVSDPGIFRTARRVIPDMEIHISTQANCTNSESANFWVEQGAKRIILARELPITEIEIIRQKTEADLEMFIHGAMCMSYSGRCLLSNYLTGRDANRGECTQPCRWGYSLVVENRPDRYFPIEEDERGTYIFNSHDLCVLPYLPQLKDLGIQSWKIEGRMKSSHYVASTVKVYREAIDTLWDKGEDQFKKRLNTWLDEMNKVSHRDYSPGFLFGKPGAEAHNIESSNYIREYNFIGKVLTKEESPAVDTDYQGYWIEQRNHFKKGDILEVLTPLGEPWTFKVGAIYDADGQELDVARHAMQKLRLELPKPMEPFSILRKPEKQE